MHGAPNRCMAQQAKLVKALAGISRQDITPDVIRASAARQQRLIDSIRRTLGAAERQLSELLQEAARLESLERAADN